MTSSTPAHDYLLPRLSELVDDAVAHGIDREVVVAVLIDLITSPRFNDAASAPDADSEPRAGWDRGSDSLVLVAGRSPNGPHVVGHQDEADFIRPINPMFPN